jgi:XRE family transcriptional regulator, regulator of sulfur utilization
MLARILTASPDGALEIYEVTIPPNASSQWHSHGPGVREYAYVLHGRLTVETGDDRFLLNPGDLVGFSADRSHSYRSGNAEVRVLCVMRYGRR